MGELADQVNEVARKLERLKSVDTLPSALVVDLNVIERYKGHFTFATIVLPNKLFFRDLLHISAVLKSIQAQSQVEKVILTSRNEDEIRTSSKKLELSLATFSVSRQRKDLPSLRIFSLAAS